MPIVTVRSKDTKNIFLESYGQTPGKRLKHDDVMRGREHERQPRSRRRCSSYDDDEEQEASETSSLPPPAEEKKQGACHHDHDRFEFSDALLARLSEIRASPSPPWFVDMKRLHSTDVRDDQNRLQLSGRSPISRILTDAEKARVRKPDGMPVTAFDLRGQRHEMTCKLWREDKHYRFMGAGWKSFRQAHGLTVAKEGFLTRRVTVKLWAFRSHALRLTEVKKDAGGGEEDGPGHPDGALGLVVLLVDEGELEEGAGEEDEVEVEVAVAARGGESCATKFLELMGAVALLLLWTRDD